MRGGFATIASLEISKLLTSNVSILESSAVIGRCEDLRKRKMKEGAVTVWTNWKLRETISENEKVSLRCLKRQFRNLVDFFTIN